MKKLLILLIAFSLFTACNNDKGPANDRDNRTNNNRDDYRNDDKDNDDRNNDDRNNDDRNNDDRDNTNRDDDPPVDDRDRDDDSKSSGNWTSRDVDEFVNSCVGEASKDGAMSRSKATSYCECMQVKLEKLYPNSNDVGNIDINSSSMQKMVRDCLE